MDTWDLHVVSQPVNPDVEVNTEVVCLCGITRAWQVTYCGHSTIDFKGRPRRTLVTLNTFLCQEEVGLSFTFVARLSQPGFERTRTHRTFLTFEKLFDGLTFIPWLFQPQVIGRLTIRTTDTECFPLTRFGYQDMNVAAPDVGVTDFVLSTLGKCDFVGPHAEQVDTTLTAQRTRITPSGAVPHAHREVQEVGSTHLQPFGYDRVQLFLSVQMTFENDATRRQGFDLFFQPTGTRIEHTRLEVGGTRAVVTTAYQNTGNQCG
ncbi:hypothetical protein D3C81_190550 [compost metagenome]